MEIKDVNLMSMEELSSALFEDTDGTEGVVTPEEAEGAKDDTSDQSQDQQVKNESQPPKSEFSFDRKKYEDQGVKDEVAFSILEKQEKEIWEKEKFIGKQSSNVGDLRKKQEEYVQRIQSLEQEKLRLSSNIISKEEFEDKMVSSPHEAMQRYSQSSQTESKLQELGLQQKMMQTSLENYNLIPDLDTRVNAMVEVMRLDGVPEDMINGFKQSPSNYFVPVKTIELAKRAETLAEVSKVKSQMAALQAERDELAKRNKESVTRLRNVQQNNPTMGSGTASSPTAKRDISTIPPHLLTIAELKEIINGE